MSAFLHRLNKIRTARTETWLTASQQIAMEQVFAQARMAPALNLYGRVGTGKTFLAWMIAERLDYPFVAHPHKINEWETTFPHAGVIIDNCSPERTAHRELLKELSMFNVAHAVLVSRKAIEDYIHHVQVHCTLDDFTHAQSNLASISAATLPQNALNLWALVNP